jgi:hypothetical protein
MPLIIILCYTVFILLAFTVIMLLVMLLSASSKLSMKPLINLLFLALSEYVISPFGFHAVSVTRFRKLLIP